MAQPIFSGSALECLKHYLNRLPPPTTRAGAAARNPIISFCQCARKTIRHWMRGQPPIGTMLVRVRYFLDAHGYRVEELERLTPLIRDLGALVAYGILNLKQATEAMGYKQEWDLLNALHGKQIPNNLKQRAVPLIIEHRAVLEKRMAEYRMQGFIPAAPPADTPGLRPSSKDARSTTAAIGSDRRLVITSLAAMLKAVLPLAELLDSEEFSEDERHQLRTITGRDGVFRLANTLHRLCGEEARAQLQASTHRTPAPTGKRR